MSKIKLAIIVSVLIATVVGIFYYVTVYSSKSKAQFLSCTAGKVCVTNKECGLDGYCSITQPLPPIKISDKKMPLRPTIGKCICKSSVPTPTPTPPLNTFGSAASFDGKTGVITANGSSKIVPNFGFTIEARIKPSLLSKGGTIISKSDGTSDSFTLTFFSNTKDQTGKNIVNYELYIGDNNCVVRTIFQQQTLTDNEFNSWQHVAGVVQADGKMDIFVNGKRSTINSNFTKGFCNKWQYTSITFGGRMFTPKDISGEFAGLIDEVHISNISRYPDNFIPPVKPFVSDKSTLLLYHFDQAICKQATVYPPPPPICVSTPDSSGNNFEGKINGNVQFVNDTQTITPTLTPIPGTSCLPGNKCLKNADCGPGICSNNRCYCDSYNCSTPSATIYPPPLVTPISVTVMPFPTKKL